ncbi:hypothetical protein [Cytobacillus pseudoceanisediminis]|uniref:hypothetical protein n=1 Tax=Cytobacillus pseudoceanisediminis TaxID=3051614 RepID=UPI003C2FEC4D
MKKVLLSSLAFVLFFTAFAGFGSASEISEVDYTEEEIEELAKQLEIFYEEVAIKDENGYVVDIDFDKFEEEFGSLPGFKESLIVNDYAFDKNLTVEPSIGVMASMPTPTEKRKINDCLNNKIKTAYKEYFSVSALATVFTLLYDGNYKLGAKHLIKMGIKANIFTLSAQLLYWHGSCIYKVKGW